MSPRIAYRILLGAAVLSLALFAWLARYAHPMGDDWSYARMGMDHALLPWLKDQYHTWNGRYFSNILVWADPIANGLDRLWLYRCVPAVLILLTFLGYTALVRALLREELTSGQHAAGGLMLTALFFMGMPQIAEGLYWYTGAISYQTGTALTLLLVAAVVNHAKGRYMGNRVVSMAGTALLAIAAIGCSEVNMLLIVAGACVWAVIAWKCARRVPSPLIALVVLVIGCGTIMYLAPGNGVRASYFDTKHEFWRSMGMTVLQMGRFGIKWAGLLFLPSLLYLHFVNGDAGQRPEAQRSFGFGPWWGLAALAGVLFLCVFPAYWNTGILGQHRTLNVAFAFFIPIWFASLKAMRDRFLPSLVPDPQVWRMSLGMVLVPALIFMVGNGQRALGDLVEGTAAAFDAQMTARYELIEAARTSTGPIVLPPITAEPQALYLYDITEDPSFWANRAYGLYFDLRDRPFTAAPQPKP